MLRNRYDVVEERGRPLSRSVDGSIKPAFERYATTDAALESRAKRYFERTLRLLSQMGTTQAVVLMPLHPRLLAAVRSAGWEERHDEVMTFLTELQGRYGFVLLDCSNLATFKGDPKNFYDGFHVKQANARRLTRSVVVKLPAVFAETADTPP